MTDPTDKELLEFVARFVGHENLEWRGDNQLWSMNLVEVGSPVPPNCYVVPDYLHDLNAWLRDVWPKIEKRGEQFEEEWLNALVLDTNRRGKFFNADARSRCIALFRALEVKLL